MIGMYKNGKCIAMHIAGNENVLRAYGLEKCCFTADDLKKELDIGEEKSVIEFCKQVDPKKSLRMFEKLMNIELYND